MPSLKISRPTPAYLFAHACCRRLGRRLAFRAFPLPGLPRVVSSTLHVVPTYARPWSSPYMFILSRILACFAGRLLVLFFHQYNVVFLGVVLVLHVRVSRIVIGSRRNSLYSYFVFGTASMQAFE